MDSPNALLDLNTPQGMAFEEILAEKLEDGFRIIQRFALMTLYYSTNGQNWAISNGPDVFTLKEFGTFSKGWNLFSPDECTWHGVKCRSEENGSTAAVTSIQLGTLLSCLE